MEGLLAAGADVDEKDEDDVSVHAQTGVNHPQSVEELLEAGGDLGEIEDNEVNVQAQSSFSHPNALFTSPEPHRPWCTWASQPPHTHSQHNKFYLTDCPSEVRVRV